MRNCSVCGSGSESLGILGRTEHFRCRSCGLEFFSAIEKREPEGDGDPCGDRDCDDCEIGGCAYWGEDNE